jgi:hypothetical protein
MSVATICSRKLFSERSHYQPENRAQLADLLRPFWKDEPFSDEQRLQMYGLSIRDFCLAERIEQADIAVLPMTWNHYLARRQVPLALDFIQAARRADRPIISYVSGDEGVTVPSGFDDVYVVRASGFQTRKRERQIAQPVFFDDPAHRYPDLFRLDSAPSRARGPWSVVSSQSSVVSSPSVGFCGQAGFNPVNLLVDLSRCLCRNGTYHLGFRREEPQPLCPPRLLRTRAIHALSRSSSVRTRFILRTRYRAGAVEGFSREQTTRAFYENVAQTDYTLCVRGGGNFSKRFYETLAMGRIPVLLDTDCLLPFEDVLPWDDFIVRVPQAELPSLPEKVAEHFTRHGSAGLAHFKRKCRQLWKEFLTFGGFHRHLVRMILASNEEHPENYRWTRTDAEERPPHSALHTPHSALL